MTAPRLFPEPSQPEPQPEPSTAAQPPVRPEAVRVVRPVRNQVEWAPRDLDSALAADHPARSIWRFLEQLDLSAFYASVRSLASGPGRPAADPRVLLGLWLLATVEGVGSARRLDALCTEHDAYRWMAGGVPVNYHLLADFRTHHEQALDGLLTEIVASMLAAELVTLERVAQDGMIVRASAGAASFRGGRSLERCLEEARDQVERLARERESPDPTVNRRQQAARERAAREREERVQEALRLLPEAQQVKERQGKSLARAKRGRVTEPRLSTTDPEAHVMRQGDGGFRPSYNVQLATDAASGVIVGASVINDRSEFGQMPPMEAQVRKRTGRHPDCYLVDGGFVKLNDITTLAKRKVTVYAPVPKPRSGRRSPVRPGDSEAVIAWRARMEQPEAQAIYRHRAASAEWSNAQLRERHGLRRFTVRGLKQTLSVVLLMAITHNLLRWRALTAA